MNGKIGYFDESGNHQNIEKFPKKGSTREDTVFGPKINEILDSRGIEILYREFLEKLSQTKSFKIENFRHFLIHLCDLTKFSTDSMTLSSICKAGGISQTMLNKMKSLIHNFEDIIDENVEINQITNVLEHYILEKVQEICKKDYNFVDGMFLSTDGTVIIKYIENSKFVIQIKDPKLKGETMVNFHYHLDENGNIQSYEKRNEAHILNLVFENVKKVELVTFYPTEEFFCEEKTSDFSNIYFRNKAEEKAIFKMIMNGNIDNLRKVDKIILITYFYCIYSLDKSKELFLKYVKSTEFITEMFRIVCTYRNFKDKTIFKNFRKRLALIYMNCKDDSCNFILEYLAREMKKFLKLDDILLYQIGCRIMDQKKYKYIFKNIQNYLYNRYYEKHKEKLYKTTTISHIDNLQEWCEENKYDINEIKRLNPWLIGDKLYNGNWIINTSNL